MVNRSYAEYVHAPIMISNIRQSKPWDIRAKFQRALTGKSFPKERRTKQAITQKSKTLLGIWKGARMSRRREKNFIYANLICQN